MSNPGDKIQADVKYVPYRIKGQQHYQYTALDDCTKWRFAKIYYELSVTNIKAFFKQLLKAAPFKIKTVQTDNGVEFTYKFVSDPKCIDKLPPHPKTKLVLWILRKTQPTTNYIQKTSLGCPKCLRSLHLFFAR